MILNFGPHKCDCKYHHDDFESNKFNLKSFNHDFVSAFMTLNYFTFHKWDAEAHI